MPGLSRLDRDNVRWWRPHYVHDMWLSRFKVGETPYVFHVGDAASGWVVPTPPGGSANLSAETGHDTPSCLDNFPKSSHSK